MKQASLNWLLHRKAVDQRGFLLPFSAISRKARILFISENDLISHSQLFPFFYHRNELGISFRELPLADFRKGKNPYRHQKVDAVCLQTWYDLSEEAMTAHLDSIKNTWPDAKIAYFDWFSPTDLRYANVLNGSISLYAKKHVLKDYSQYQRTTLGDTNLTDYYAKRFGINYPETHFPVPKDFYDKLWISPHFVFTNHIMPYFLGTYPAKTNRAIDLHARIATKGSQWYSTMRQEALDKAVAWENKCRIVYRGRVSRNEFFQELFNSKMCFSPFGFGEFCWRDFEAMLTGSLLLKPDMSHLKHCPGTFILNETYVPLAWDLSDFDEKVDYYLRHPQEREAIARNAFEHMATYFREQQFLNDAQPFLQKLGLTDKLQEVRPALAN